MTMQPYDATCEPSLRSWVESANSPATDFPVQNLPFGVFRRKSNAQVRRSADERGGLSDAQAHIGVAIGDEILDLHGLAGEGLLDGLGALTAEACRGKTLNGLMALGLPHAAALRVRLSELLREEPLRDTTAEREVLKRHLVAQRDAEMLLPAAIGDYTDFYSSIEHATRIGSMLRPDRPLLPNYKHIPIGYHGRASSIVVSGSAIRRPHGQLLAGEMPIFAPTQRMDYEAELGLFIGMGNALGSPVAIDEAPQHMFGCCLSNDWSARDIQAWEYQPLGPFLSKSYATSLSPWVVTMDALAPFRTRARRRAVDDPPVLPYLFGEEDEQSGAFDIQIEVRLSTAAMRANALPPALLSQSSVRTLYWTLAQLLTHHASNGCNLRPGDLLATGTVSGERDSARGCLMELTRRGETPVQLPGGEQRAYLLDGDEVTMTAYCAKEGARRIGFGECRGVVAG
jgi:fumarylacetoacetase